MKTKKKQNNNKKQKPKWKQEDFPVSSICRADFKLIGYDASNVDDETMHQIAAGLNDVFRGSLKMDLETAIELFDLPKRKPRKPTA